MTINIATVDRGQLVSALDLDDISLRDPDQVLAITNLDVVDGLRPTFEPTDENIRLVPEYEPMLGVSQAMASVPWEYECRHVEALGQIEGNGLRLGAVPATGRNLKIEGLTLLRDLDDRIEFRRYVDWNLVLADLGVTASFRAGQAS